MLFTADNYYFCYLQADLASVKLNLCFSKFSSNLLITKSHQIIRLQNFTSRITGKGKWGVFCKTTGLQGL